MCLSGRRTGVKNRLPLSSTSQRRAGGNASEQHYKDETRAPGSNRAFCLPSLLHTKFGKREMVVPPHSGVAAHPPAHAATHAPAHSPAKPHAAAKVHKPVAQGAGGVKTPPRPVRSAPPAHATDPKVLAFRAETLASAVQDARINNSDNIWPTQDKASKATVANLVAHRKIDDYNKFQLEVTQAKFQDLQKKLGDMRSEISDPLHAATRSEKAELKKLQQDVDRAHSKFLSARKASERSGRDVAVALDLHEIVLGARAGRVTLSGKTGLADARAAQDRLDSALQAVSSASKRGQPLGEEYFGGGPLQTVRDAASVNRAEWKALNSRAEKDHNAELIKVSRVGLAKAEIRLESVYSPEFKSGYEPKSGPKP
jgi:hypothetical protein